MRSDLVFRGVPSVEVGKVCNQSPPSLRAAVIKWNLDNWAASSNSLATFDYSWDSLHDFCFPTSLLSARIKPPLSLLFPQPKDHYLLVRVYCLNYYHHVPVLRGGKK